MVVSTTFIAVDWGTTNRRIFVIADGRVVASERDAAGAAAVSDFPAEIAAMRARWGAHPVLLAGMVGSTIGWCAVPYVAAPASIETLAAALTPVAPEVRIVPGVSVVADGHADVMRGEEVQLLGAAAAGLVPEDAQLCQPGTHSKWATLTDGRITGFVTAMTGELFGLVRAHGVLAAQMKAEVATGGAFREGVVEGARRDLAASLFNIRAAGLLGLREDTDAASYASGVLIGADVAARLNEARGATVHLLSDAMLGGLYAAAIATLGGTCRRVDSEAAFLAGITHIQELAR